MNSLSPNTIKLPARWYLKKATTETRTFVTIALLCVINLLVYYIAYLYLPPNEFLLFPVILITGWSIFAFNRALNYAPEVISLHKNTVVITRNKKQYEIPFRELGSPILERTSAFPFLNMLEGIDDERIDLIRLRVKCLNPAYFRLANQKRELLIECMDSKRNPQSQLPYTYSGSFYPSLRIRHKDAYTFLQQLKQRIEETLQ